MDPFLGQIMMFGGNFAPRGWALCDGQLIAISSNSALFSILGTMYGGDGRTTFALPDLRGRVAVHAGNGPGLMPVDLGQKFGTNTTTLLTQNLPAHNHAAAVTVNSSLHFRSEVGDETSPNDGSLAIAPPAAQIYHADPPQTGKFHANSITNVVDTQIGMTGNNQSFNNMQPSYGVYYIIAIQGSYPSRS
ncbi:MAG: tail fiber protein [Bacteroidota bacterium]